MVAARRSGFLRGGKAKIMETEKFIDEFTFIQ